MPEVVFLRLHVAAVAGAFTCTERGPQDDDSLRSKRAPLSNAATAGAPPSSKDRNASVATAR